MRIAVTGDKGFIGSHLVKKLKNEGHKVFGFDNNKYNLFKFESLKNFVRNKDVIIHLAGVNRGNESEIISGNICITHNLLLAMEKFKSKAKLIYSSSVQVETNSLYGISKKLTELILKDYSQRLKIPITIFRIINVFGEGCRPFYNSVIATFCYQAAQQQKFSINNPSKKFRFIYVEDVIDKIIKEAKASGKKLFQLKNLDSVKSEISIGKLAKLIKSFQKIKKAPSGKFYRDLYNTYKSYEKVKN